MASPLAPTDVKQVEHEGEPMNEPRARWIAFWLFGMPMAAGLGLAFLFAWLT